MNNKEQAFKNIEGRIDSIEKLSLECLNLIHDAAWNEAIEKAAAYCDKIGEMGVAQDLRELKKDE